MAKSIWTSIVILTLCVGMLQAGDEARLGTTAGSQLLIPTGARSLGMGGLLSDVAGSEAIFWNPAGITYGTGNEVMFNNMSWLADIDVSSQQHSGRMRYQRIVRESFSNDTSQFRRLKFLRAGTRFFLDPVVSWFA